MLAISPAGGALIPGPFARRLRSQSSTTPAGGGKCWVVPTSTAWRECAVENKNVSVSAAKVVLLPERPLAGSRRRRLRRVVAPAKH